jgi:shikimate kinase
MRIYLVGFMGCGKSTTGRKLAKLTGLNFIDLDKYIEERAFKSIPLIFSEEGEKGFREKERRSLEEVSQFENVVIGTGGGTPCFFDNMEMMNRSGFTVYLAPDTETLADRILRSKTERPLVSGKTKEELIIYINETLKIRSPFYDQARLVIRGDVNYRPEIIIGEIEKLKS